MSLSIRISNKFLENTMNLFPKYRQYLLFFIFDSSTLLLTYLRVHLHAMYQETGISKFNKSVKNTSSIDYKNEHRT